MTRLADTNDEEMNAIYTADLVDAFGSILRTRNNRGLNYQLLRALRVEERKWKVADVSKLIGYVMELPEVGGDQTSLAYKTQLKLRDMENWARSLKSPHRLLQNLLDMSFKHHVRLSIHHQLVRHILTREKGCVIRLAKMMDSENHMSDFQRVQIAKKA